MNISGLLNETLIHLCVVFYSPLAVFLYHLKCPFTESLLTLCAYSLNSFTKVVDMGHIWPKYGFGMGKSIWSIYGFHMALIWYIIFHTIPI